MKLRSQKYQVNWLWPLCFPWVQLRESLEHITPANVCVASFQCQQYANKLFELNDLTGILKFKIKLRVSSKDYEMNYGKYSDSTKCGPKPSNILRHGILGKKKDTT